MIGAHLRATFAYPLTHLKRSWQFYEFRCQQRRYQVIFTDEIRSLQAIDDVTWDQIITTVQCDDAPNENCDDVISFFVH